MDIQKLSKVRKSSIRLECDWFTVQGRVKENGVAYHPTAVLLVDHNNGLIVGHILLPPIPDYDSMLSKIPGEVIRFLISKDLNPDRIYVVHETKKHILDSGLRRAGIITETRPQLPNVNEAREGLDDMLLNGMPAFNN
jgi:hypothetical protein